MGLLDELLGGGQIEVRAPRRPKVVVPADIGHAKIQKDT
jgi:hypothetical protein